MTETIFFNVWQTDSRERQAALLAEMRSEARALAAKPGFLGLTVWVGLDANHRVLVEGRWASRAHFDAAVGESSQATAARARLEELGKGEPGLFTESFQLGSQASEATTAAESAVAFIQVWEVGKVERQRGWLATMRENVGVLTDKPGFQFMRTHASEDSKRVAVYAQWRDRASLEAGVNTPEAKAAHQAMRTHGTPDGTVYEVSDVFLPNPAAGLFEKVSSRWAALGFESTTITVNGVDLHVVSGGEGTPLVLLHGYPQSGEIWRFVAPELAKKHRVVIPDLPGMGLSAIANNGFDLPNVADDMNQLISKLGLTEVAVAGHDWGAAVGAVWALRHRADLRRFAFIESAVGGAGFESIWNFDRANPAMTFIPFLLSDPLAESLIVGREEIFLHHLWNTFTYNKDRVPFDAWQPYIDAMKRPGLIRSSASFYRSVYAAVGRIREMIGTGKLTIPVLSISGEASFGASQKGFVEAFASNIVKHAIVGNSGHFVAEEQPEALLAEFRAFFDD
jgi:pimeloyl-ACP methyl ester carboxylesterase/heme-degrading monooxygenase HmoA